MKLSALLLTALSAAVLSGCEKSDVQPATEEPQQSSPETIRPTGGGGNNPSQPYCCPACGMG